MPTQIRQIDDLEREITTLRIAGEVLQNDAELIQRIALEIRAKSGRRVVIDIGDLSFVDSEAAPILKHLDELEGFGIEGAEIFLQTVVNDAERRGA